MRFLPSGGSALLVELDDLDEVLALYAALTERRPDGLIDIVPAARTVLLVTDPARTDLASLERVVRSYRPRRDRLAVGDLVEIPVVYDGADLDDVASMLGCDVAEVIRRHTGDEWVVAFCGFAPGFGYMTASSGGWDLPRKPTPRTSVPAGAVALAGGFCGIYPRASPGGWQLLGHTDVVIFDVNRDPAALLRPGTRVRFAEVRRS